MFAYNQRNKAIYKSNIYWEKLAKPSLAAGIDKWL